MTVADHPPRFSFWSPARQHLYLEQLQAKLARERSLVACADPAELAKSIDPDYVITPALKLIAGQVERALVNPASNLLVTMPPQEGKSTLCAVWAVIRALQHNPDTKVILATYADALAETHSIAARAIIQRAGSRASEVSGEDTPDQLGVALARDKAAAKNWRIAHHRGGLIAVGVNSTITGRQADLFIIDDPYKNHIEADSAAHRKKVSEWVRSVVYTRLSPSASVILIQTRWHYQDIAGELLEQDRALPEQDRTWTYVNIPAISAPGVPDSLGRTEPGVAMESARAGRDLAAFQRTRRNVGERVFWALYQGEPTPPGGGLFHRAWFDHHRIGEEPPQPMATVVGVDPAETGERDEAGIVVGSLTHDAVVTLTFDYSGHYTSDQWARRAVQAALRHGASQIVVECYTAGTTYVRLVQDALRSYSQKALRLYQQGLPLEVEPGVHWRGTPGEWQHIQVQEWRGKGDALIRSAPLRQALETGRCRVLGTNMGELESQACMWQQGQHQPDRVAAAVIVYDQLSQLLGREAEFPDFRGAERGVGRNPWLRRRLGA